MLVYLHISGVGPLLGSGFWLIASERFDPRTAKQRFGQIAGAGTLGGLLERAARRTRRGAASASPAMLPVLAAFHFVSAWQVRRLADRVATVADAAAAVETFRNPTAAPTRSGLRVIAEAPYLRNLAALVLLGTTGAALLDYLFKAQAVETFGRGDNLLRFFAVYYAATSLDHVRRPDVVEPLRARAVRPGVTTSTPSLALLAGSVGGLLAPGFGEHRRGARRRVGVPRLAVPRRLRAVLHADSGGGEARRQVDHRRRRSIVWATRSAAAWSALALLLAPAAQSSAILSLAMACSVARAARREPAESRLHRHAREAACSTAPSSSISPTSRTPRPGR